MKVLLALIFAAYVLGIYVNAKGDGACLQLHLRCGIVCRPERCRDVSLEDCSNPTDYYIQPACTVCNACPKCEKYREKGQCCYSPYGSELKCKDGLICSSRTKVCGDHIE